MWAMEDVSGGLLIPCKTVTIIFCGPTEGRAFCDRERPGSGKGVRVGRRVTAAERSWVGQSVLGTLRWKPLTGGGQAFSICTSCKCPHSTHVNKAQRNHTIWTQSHSRYNSQGECLEVLLQAPLHTRKPITIYTTVTWTSTSAGVWGSTLPSVDELCRPVILGIPEAEVGGPE